MRNDAIRNNSGLVSSFKGGADTFFFKGVNGRWKDVLSSQEQELYHRKVNQLLSPEGRAWIENGRVALR
jgi:aryl sulfotransferase